MTTFALAARKAFVTGGWAPLLVFLIHIVQTNVLDLYSDWPRADIPMHFAGGLSIAYFVSRCFRALARDEAPDRGRIVLEAVLVVSLTATAAVLWELAEFALDRVTGTNLQVSLANTMQDLAVGILGAVAFVALRARRLGAGAAEIRRLARGWLNGRAA